MNHAAEKVMDTFADIWLAYGQSDEYSFVLKKTSTLYQRRIEKIVSCVVSCFSSAFTLGFSDFFPERKLDQIPIFDSRIVCYPDSKSLRDYLNWRQVDCHINNLYNTCFWKLVEKGLTNVEAEKTLKGTLSNFKNELLFKEFNINYNSIEDIYRKGTIFIRTFSLKEKHKSTKS
jgi:tRNA(His) guanylyltransferase